MGLFDFFKTNKDTGSGGDAKTPWGAQGNGSQANGPLKKSVTPEPGAYHHDTMFTGSTERIDIETERLISIITSAYQRGRMDVRDRNDGVDRGNNLENVLKDTMKEIGAIDSE